LKPNADKVLVMKLVPVDVQAVDWHPCEELEDKTRVSVDIVQPARHSIFIQRSDKVGPEFAMAVGASNVDVQADHYVMGVDKTFLTLRSEQPSLRRTNSSPGCLQSQGVLALCAECSSSSAKNTETVSSLSSEVTPVGSDDVRIRIGVKGPVNVPAGIAALHVLNDEGRASLQDCLTLQRSGIPSMGSLQHRDGCCTSACWFENQRQHGRLKTCSAGFACERCHFDHDFLKRTRKGAVALQ